MNEDSKRAREERDDVVLKGGDPAHWIDRERIARRAYEIYESRHRADGDADQDWFQAMSEYVARRESEPTTAFGPGASRSFADRTRIARQ